MSDAVGPTALTDLLAEHQPVLGLFSGIAGIVGCSCLSARDYRAAGHKAGQAGYRTHLAAILAARADRSQAAAEALDEVTLLRDLARRCHNGAPDPYQEFYNLGLSPLLDRFADALVRAAHGQDEREAHRAHVAAAIHAALDQGTP